VNTTEIERLSHFEDWYWWHRARTAIVTSLLRRAVTPRSTNRVLDVGCGAGGTSVALGEFGSVLGVDAHSAATARERGLHVASMDARRLALRAGSFDVAVALDVMEHLDDDAAAARELRRILRDDGLLLVSVPAYQGLWSNHDVALGHVRRYTRSEVVSLLERSGFEVEMASYAMGLVLAPAFVVRLLERVWPRRTGLDEKQSGYLRLPRPANAALSWLVALDRHTIGRVPIPCGLSVIAIAWKVA
jgi:SAM-dependent methyltransferase